RGGAGRAIIGEIDDRSAQRDERLGKVLLNRDRAGKLVVDRWVGRRRQADAGRVQRHQALVDAERGEEVVLAGEVGLSVEEQVRQRGIGLGAADAGGDDRAVSRYVAEVEAAVGIAVQRGLEQAAGVFG